MAAQTKKIDPMELLKKLTPKQRAELKAAIDAQEALEANKRVYELENELEKHGYRVELLWARNLAKQKGAVAIVEQFREEHDMQQYDPLLQAYQKVTGSKRAIPTSYQKAGLIRHQKTDSGVKLILGPARRALWRASNEQN